MISKDAAAYTDAATGLRICRHCSMYRSGGTCTLVRGTISPHGHCRYWAGVSRDGAPNARNPDAPS